MLCCNSKEHNMPPPLPQPALRDWLWLMASKRKFFPKRKRRAKWRAMWQFEAKVAGLQPGDIAIDCGASDGQCTRRLAATGATVYAFEPDPHGFARLETMFAGIANIKLMEQAVGIEPARVPLFRSPTFAVNPDRYVQASSLYASKADVASTDGIFVEQIDLLSFITALPHRVALLKLDIEGSEVPILERLFDTGMVSRVDCIFAETHERIVPELVTRTIALRQRVARENLLHVNLDWI
jgi:FkbM family methyltransferase